MNYKLIIILSIVLILNGCVKQRLEGEYLIFSYTVESIDFTEEYVLDFADETITYLRDQRVIDQLKLLNSDTYYQNIYQLMIDMDMMSINGGYYPKTLYLEDYIKDKTYPRYQYDCAYMYESTPYYFYFEDYYEIDQLETIEFTEALKTIRNYMNHIPEFKELNHEKK